MSSKMGPHLGHCREPQPQRRAWSAEPLDHGRAGVALGGEEVADLLLHEGDELLAVHLSALLRNTTRWGTPTCLASCTCSRVWGMTPSAAETTRMAPSIWAAPGDHVLDVVRVARDSPRGRSARGRLVLDAGGVDADVPRLLLGGLVDLVVGRELGQAGRRQDARDGGRQGGLAVVHVAQGPDVDVRLGPLGHCARHLQVSYPIPSAPDHPGVAPDFENRVEPATRIELVTSSLPRMRSTD